MKNIFLIIVLVILPLSIQTYRISQLKGDVAFLKHDIDLLTTDVNSANTKVKELEDANYLLTRQEAYARANSDYLTSRCTDIVKRLKTTTDILEGEMTCNVNGISIENCLRGLPVNDLIDLNRDTQF